MNTRLVWSAALLACVLHGRVVGQTAPAKPTNIDTSNKKALPLPVITPTITNPNVASTGHVTISPAGTDAKPVLNIQTKQQTNIVNWNSFNIGNDATVKIGQPNASAVLLNNIVGGNTSPTLINGILKNMDGMSSGRVYFYDPAGIVFGAGARVNLNSLIASTLRFDENRLKAGGLLMPGTGAALSAASSEPLARRSILVGSGASIEVENGGQILLAAPGVYNEGQIYAPDGQVILAAGDKVYLASPDTKETGTKLRGLVVEVQNIKNSSNQTLPSLASNSGVIRVDRGNATMVGLAVNQTGLVSAQTSVNLNGSIYLRAISASDSDLSKNKDKDKTTSYAGNVDLAAGSVTEVIPRDDKQTLTLDSLSLFNKSEIKIFGNSVLFEDKYPNTPGPQVLAKGGDVDIQSRQSIRLGSGTLIDVSGMNTAQLEMSNNIIEVQLQGTELADNPLIRDSALYGKKINVDVRQGAPLANIDGWLKLVKYKIDQVNSTAGNITLFSNGDLITKPGSL